MVSIESLKNENDHGNFMASVYGKSLVGLDGLNRKLKLRHFDQGQGHASSVRGGCVVIV